MGNAKKLLIGLAVFSLILTGCGSSDDSSSKKDPKEETKTYKVNEEVKVTVDEGEYKFMVTGVKETKDRNEFAQTNPKKVVIISYEYENISLTDELSISSMVDLKAYDKEGNALETYPDATVKEPTYLPAGKKTTADVAYALDSDENYIELDYDNSFYSKEIKAKFELTW